MSIGLRQLDVVLGGYSVGHRRSMPYTVMPFVIAQISDIHIGGPNVGNGERFSMAVAEIGAMTSAPDVVLLTGDLTHNGLRAEWDELVERLDALSVPWLAIAGNHDRGISEWPGIELLIPVRCG